MTRTYALKRLLEHGDMNRMEIMEVMGGSKSAASEAICSLHKQGIICRKRWEWAAFSGVSRKSPVYGLVDA